MPDPPSIEAPRSRALLIAVLVAGALVVARSAIFWLYEQAFFDSDQAIVGLMAKHLVEGRAFPLFYYGQTYMLVVDAWVAAPLFAVFGATVRSLHGALILMNLVAVALLVAALVRDLRLTAPAAVVSLLMFAFAPPHTSASLIEAGANIAPFIAVTLLWFWRSRPLLFGLVLGIGLHNREFTAYAVLALLAGEIWQRTLFRRDRLRTWLVALVATMAVWQGIDVLKSYSDMMGPHTRGRLVEGESGSPLTNVRDRVAVEPSEWPERTRAMLWEHLPGLWGLAPLHDATADQGRRWLFWPVAVSLLLAMIRVVWLRGRPGPDGRIADGVGWYLATVGALAIVVYVLTRPAGGVVHRYLLLSLFFPIGLVALHLAHERRRALRAITMGVMLVWAGSSAVDHWGQVTRYTGGHEPNEMRTLADAMTSRGIHVAEAGYWVAYKLTFLTQERVTVASTDVARIEEYQRLAREAGPALVTISTTPCPGGEAVSLWYLCK